MSSDQQGHGGAWSLHTSKRTGKRFYYNARTKQSTYRRPTGIALAADANAGDSCGSAGDAGTTRKRRRANDAPQPPPHAAPGVRVGAGAAPSAVQPNGGTAAPARPVLVVFDLDYTIWKGNCRNLDAKGVGHLRVVKRGADGHAVAVADSSGTVLELHEQAR